MDQVNRLEVERIAAAMGGEHAGEVTTWMYITCRLLAARGVLELRGMSMRSGEPDTLIFRDPRSNDIFAIQRPCIGDDAERLLSDRLVYLSRGLPH